MYEDAWRERANLSRHMPEALVPDDRQDARLFRLTLQPPKPGQVASQLKQQKGKINHSTRAYNKNPTRLLQSANMLWCDLTKQQLTTWKFCS